MNPDKVLSWGKLALLGVGVYLGYRVYKAGADIAGAVGDKVDAVNESVAKNYGSQQTPYTNLWGLGNVNDLVNESRGYQAAVENERIILQ